MVSKNSSLQSFADFYVFLVAIRLLFKSLILWHIPILHLSVRYSVFLWRFCFLQIPLFSLLRIRETFFTLWFVEIIQSASTTHWHGRKKHGRCMLRQQLSMWHFPVILNFFIFYVLLITAVSSTHSKSVIISMSCVRCFRFFSFRYDHDREHSNGSWRTRRSSSCYSYVCRSSWQTIGLFS